MIASWSTRLNIERVNRGMPLIAADPNGWDDGFTMNPAAVHLERSPRNDQIISGLLGISVDDTPCLADGAVAVFYRGVPEEKPGLPKLRSSVGLAVFTPELELLKRFPYPVVLPTDDPEGWDYNGVEDQRITRIGDTFYMVYCGYNPRLSRRHNIRICMAQSQDLLHWTKLGPISGDVNSVPNKDAVILPEPVNGKYMMLHRPCIGGQGCLSISLATSDSITGEWRDMGVIMRALRHPQYSVSWIGAGSAPIPLGDNRFLADYHTGNYYPSGARDYFASYAVLDFNRLDADRPESIVESRCEGVLVPETPYELNSPWPHDKTLNCVFPCGSYEHNGDIVLVYGGADAYVLAARLKRRELLHQLDALSHHCRPRTMGSVVRLKSKMGGRHIAARQQAHHIAPLFADGVR